MLLIALYKRQQKGNGLAGFFVMKNFISDVKLAERETGGNENIFVELESRTEVVVQPHINIRELFVTEKDRRKRSKSLLTSRTHSAFEKKKKKSTNTPCKPITMISGVYWCHIKKGCGFNSKRFDNLKRHMKMHEEEDKQKLNAKLCKNDQSVSGYRASNAQNVKAQFRSTKSLKTSKPKKLDTKKIKLQDELLKDWDEDDDENLNESTDISNANEASTSNQIFDFDEDDSNGSVTISGLRHNESTQSLLENSDTTLFQINNLQNSFENTSDENKAAPAIVNNEISGENNSNGTNLILDSAGPSNLISQELNDINRNENLSVAGTSINNKQKVDSTNGGHVDSFLSNIPTPDWVKQDAWNTFEHSGLDKGKN